MNLFVLDTNPEMAATYHCDKHVVKMILEVAQMLCTSHHVVGNSSAPYRKTHVNHPCSVWVRQSPENYQWALDLGLALCDEYTKRYGKVHKTQAVLEWCDLHRPEGLRGVQTPFVQVMPEIYKDPCAVTAYRNYYRGEKAKIARWKNGRTPDWFSTGE